MDKATYTKGPWKVFTTKSGTKLVGIGELNGDGIADAGFGVWRGGDAEAIANARLIAAAPDLVEALRDLVSDREEVAKYSWKTWMNGEWHWNDEIWERNDPDEFELIKAARAALSKATGGSHEQG